MIGQEITQNESTLSQATPDVTVGEVRFEHRRDALGIGTARPRLSWLAGIAPNNWRQAAYELEAYGPDGQLRERTGRVDSDQSVLVPWPFAPLESRERLTVRVRTWGQHSEGVGRLSAWSAPALVEAGLLDAKAARDAA
jgi:alpha-L-rhamnosidase